MRKRILIEMWHHEKTNKDNVRWRRVAERAIIAWTQQMQHIWEYCDHIIET